MGRGGNILTLLGLISRMQKIYIYIYIFFMNMKPLFIPDISEKVTEMCESIENKNKKTRGSVFCYQFSNNPKKVFVFFVA